MSKTIKYLLVAGLMFLSASASALQLKPDAPQRYVVVKGDTLWDISGRFIGNPWEWPEIWYMNDQIENPHLIYPGDVIELVNVDGEMKLMVTSRGQDSRTVKLSPTARVEPIANAIPAIPMDAIQGFMRNHQVLSRKGFENLPYVVAGEDGRVMMGAGTKVYGRLPEDAIAMQSYGIFRKGEVYRDPQTREVLGVEATDIGSAKVVSAEGQILTLMLEKTNQQVNAGDFLLQSEVSEPRSNFVPKAPELPIQGQILSVTNGVVSVGQFDVVALNRGARDGLETGHVMLVKKAGDKVYDPVTRKKIRLPSEESGRMMVFRVFDKMSYALIMSATSPLQVGDLFESPPQ
ncbi:MAG TPA: peptidoglycan-binding protein [Oceanospirillales bacterium]|nr:peptidoglycan-binding protein [Oceanospirillales bacterium]|tara:strand:+ start:10414 stop:11454 length:1041 start_codon:yes stop_codon:yes gene_type:complete